MSEETEPSNNDIIKSIEDVKIPDITDSTPKPPMDRVQLSLSEEQIKKLNSKD